VALMALIVVPIFVFRKRVNVMETQFNALSDRDKLKPVGKVAAHVASKSIGHQ
jgi:hypothetical protein